MRLPVVLSPEAEKEYDEAVDWYDKQRSGLGLDFADAIRAVLARIGANPRMHAVVYRDVRKAVVRKFRYVVIYRAEPARVSVISVFHTSRDPKDWQSRV